jgi:hypothetical protein
MAFQPKNPDPIGVPETLLPNVTFAWPGLTPPTGAATWPPTLTSTNPHFPKTWLRGGRDLAT